MTTTVSYELRQTAFYTRAGISENSDIAVLPDGAHVVTGEGAPGATSATLVAYANFPFLQYAVPGTHLAMQTLANGNLAVAWQDGDSIVYTYYDPALLQQVETVDLVRTRGANADIAAMSGGGFVIASQLGDVGGDTDIVLNFVDSSGAPGLFLRVDFSTAVDTDAKVARLDNGNIAVAWTRTIGASSQIWTAVYSSTGAVVSAQHKVDSTGTINRHVAISALAGGYALAYEDNQAGNGTTDIMLKKLNYSGATYTSQLVTATERDGFAGNETSPALARVGNNLLAVTFSDDAYGASDHDVSRQLIDGTNLALLGADHYLFTADNQYNGALTGFGLSQLASTVHNATTGQLEISELDAMRVLTGDIGNDTITADNDMDHHLIGLGGSDLLRGGNGHDLLEGGAGNDKLLGGSGSDYLDGGDNTDTLDGGTGNDTLAGGAGNDAYIVDSTGDVIIEAAGAGTDAVSSTALAYTLSANVERLTLLDFDPVSGTGNALANLITGNNNDNTLSGNDGNDTLIGGIGADTLIGGKGNDKFYIDNNNDHAVEIAGEGTDTVYVSTNGYVLDANVEILYLTEITGFASGNDGNNTLYGEFEATLMGGGGRDLLVGNGASMIFSGGAGADTITGNGGSGDRYQFDVLETSTNHDVITNFTDSTIEFKGSAFVGLSGNFGTLNPEMFGSGAYATTLEMRIMYDQATGNLWYDQDGKGGAAHVLVAVLSNHPTLTYDLFQVF